MKRALRLLIAGFLGLAANTAVAQLNPAGSIYYDNVYNRPTVSPYLNLLNPGAAFNSVPNYFTLVKPQLEQRAALNQQQSEISRLNRQVSSAPRRGQRQQSQVRSTGHATQFMFYGPYYRQMGPRRQ
ncbi:MAG: hypothetical protein U0836_16815 [Pirellulales bacterium]